MAGIPREMPLLDFLLTPPDEARQFKTAARSAVRERQGLDQPEPASPPKLSYQQQRDITEPSRKRQGQARAERAMENVVGGFAGGIAETLKVPGKAYKGKLPPEQEIGAATDLATLLMGQSPFVAPKGTAGIFGGRLAATADSKALQEAQRLERAGVPHADIQRQTGWAQGADGQWRFEISDQPARHKEPWQFAAGQEIPLEDLLHHPELYKAYPELASLPVRREDLGLGTRGAYYPNSGKIGISRSLFPEDALSTLLHELQHGVQRKEGFASGANPEMFKPETIESPEFKNWFGLVKKDPVAREYARLMISTDYTSERSAAANLWNKNFGPRIKNLLDKGKTNEAWALEKTLTTEFNELVNKRFPTLTKKEALEGKLRAKGISPAKLEPPNKYLTPEQAYWQTAGEVEARNVTQRQALSSEERRATPVWKTEDVSRSKQLLLRQGGGSAASQSPPPQPPAQLPGGQPQLPPHPPPPPTPPIGGGPPPPAHPVPPVRGPGWSTLTEVDDGLYRLGGGERADEEEFRKLAKTFSRAEPGYVMDPKAQAEFNYKIEAHGMELGPAGDVHLTSQARAAMSPNELRWWDTHLKPLKDEEWQLWSKYQRNRGVDPADIKFDPNYMRREATEHSPFARKSLMGDPFTDTGPGMLMRSGSPTKATKYYTLVNQQTGSRVVAHADDASTLHLWNQGQPTSVSFSGELRPGGQVKVGNMHLDVERPITRELEAHTPTRFVQNPMLNTSKNIVELRAIVRNQDFMRDLRANPRAKPWMTASKTHPKGWEESRIPALKGTFFHPDLKRVFDIYARGDQGPLWLDALRKAVQWTARTLFWSPTVHALNVFNHWRISRGWEWVRPSGYYNIVDLGWKAMKEVTQGGPKYLEATRAGSAMQLVRTQHHDFLHFMANKMGTEIKNNPAKWDPIARAFGLGLSDFFRAWYQYSNKAMWWAGDVMMMQRVLELERRGMSLQQAIKTAEEHIPNYRIPIDVFMGKGGKIGQNIAEAMRDSTFTMFNRYHYAIMKGVGYMVNRLVGPKATKQQRIEAAGHWMALALGSFVVMPALNKAIRSISGDKISLPEFGTGGIVSAAAKSIADRDTKAFTDFLSRMIIFSPPAKMIIELSSGRDLWSGRPIMNKKDPGWKQAKDFALHHAGTLAIPGGQALQSVQRQNVSPLLRGATGLHYHTKKDLVKERKKVREMRHKRGAGAAFQQWMTE